MGTLQRLIDQLKFQRVKQAATPLAELLDSRLPFLPKDTVVVPIPTLAAHVRQRGYDQVALLAARFAERRMLPMVSPLRRTSKVIQHTAPSKQARREQANGLFVVNNPETLEGKTVLLIDDIVTTGATLTAAANALHQAGARVWVAALAYQPLD